MWKVTTLSREATALTDLLERFCLCCAGAKTSAHHVDLALYVGTFAVGHRHEVTDLTFGGSGMGELC
jgi:hypothetical protein